MGKAKMAVKMTDVLIKYVKLRQEGGTPAHALRHIQETAEEISFEERVQLAAQIKAWEASEGVKYRPAPPEAPSAPISAPPDQLSTGSVVTPTPPASGSIETPLNPMPGIERIACPSCGKLNFINSSYCYSCGALLLNSNRSQTRAFTNAELGDNSEGDSSHFGRFTSIFLYVSGVGEPIVIEQSNETVIGRKTSDSPLQPDIDMNPYNGAELGVSRLHVSLKRHEDTVLISDMNSINHTYLNGKRLHPHEAHVLRDGDELRLGRMTLQVRFKQRLRRL